MGYIEQIDSIEEELNNKIVQIQSLRSVLARLRQYNKIEDMSQDIEKFIRLVKSVEEPIIVAHQIIDLYNIDDIIPF